MNVRRLQPLTPSEISDGCVPGTGWAVRLLYAAAQDELQGALWRRLGRTSAPRPWDRAPTPDHVTWPVLAGCRVALRESGEPLP